MEHIDVLGRTLAATGEVVHGIGADQMTAPTPCEDWTVRDVLNHIVGVLGVYVRVLNGEPRGEFNPLEKAPEIIGADPSAAYDDAAKRCLDAWQARGSVDGEIALWSDRPSPGPMVWQIATCDTLLHGWDLARATGQDYPLDAASAEFIWSQWRGKMPENFRGTAFRPAVEVPQDAPPLDQIVAYSGRTP